MPSITPYAGGYRCQVYVKGKRDSQTFERKRDAQQWGARREFELRKATRPGSQTFKSAVEKYQDEVSAKKDGGPWEVRRLNAMLLHIGDLPMAQIEAPQIAAWRDKRLKTVSGSTVVREVNLLRNLFNVARLEWHWIDHKPFDGVKMPKENAPRRDKIWTWPLIKRALRAERTGKTREMQDAFHIALRSGMRLQEVLAAPQAFDSKRQVVTLKTKTERRAEIPIGRIASKMLLRAPFAVEPNEGSVLFSKLCRELMIKGLTFHDTRGTALTHLSKKVDVLTLARIARIKDVSLLSRVYYRVTADEIARGI